MNTIKDKIAEILYDELYEVCCSTCDNKSADADEYGGHCHPCWSCKKDHVNWQLSYRYAEELSDKILNCIKEVERQELKERYDECLEVLNRGIDYYRGK